MKQNKIILSFFLLFLCLVSVSAIELNLNKTQSCELFNYTGTTCDSFWCVSGLKGNWTIDEICLINQTVENLTNITNQTNQTLVYNESLIYEIAYNASRDYANNNSLVNASLLILVKNGILDTQDNKTEELVRSYVASNTPVREPLAPGVIIGIVLILGAVIIAVAYFNSKNKPKSPWDDFNDTPEYNHKKPYKGKEENNKKGAPSPKEVRDFEATGDVPEAEEEK